MSQMIMLVGPTGCGKTTYRKKHLYGIPCVSPDDFVVGKWTPNKCGLAWRHAEDMTRALLRGKEPFVVDAQFLDRGPRRSWLRLAQKAGFTVHAVVFQIGWRNLLCNHKIRGNRAGYGVVPFRVIQAAYKQHKGLSLDNDGFDTVKIVKFEETFE